MNHGSRCNFTPLAPYVIEFVVVGAFRQNWFNTCWIHRKIELILLDYYLTCVVHRIRTWFKREFLLFFTGWLFVIWTNFCAAVLVHHVVDNSCALFVQSNFFRKFVKIKKKKQPFYTLVKSSSERATTPRVCRSWNWRLSDSSWKLSCSNWVRYSSHEVFMWFATLTLHSVYV